MSLTTEAMRRLVEFGLTAEQILAVAEANEPPAPVRTARQERNRRYYEKRLKASEQASYSDVLNDPLPSEVSPQTPLPTTPPPSDPKGSSSPAEPGGKTPAKAGEAYPEPFETAWRAYPHTKGRSSKPESLALWRKLPREARAGLPEACRRYARDGKEPNDKCGAPAMDRWLKRGLYADWLDPPSDLLTGATAADPLAPWRPRAKAWRESRYWPETWGPRPGEAGCGCPPGLLEAGP